MVAASVAQNADAALLQGRSLLLAKMGESNRPRLEPTMEGAFGSGEMFVLLFAAVVLGASVFWV